MRGIAVAALAFTGCLRTVPEPGPPPSYPTFELDKPADPNPMDLADLKGIAGAAAIALEVGPAPVLPTTSCGDYLLGATAAHATWCYRCTLAVVQHPSGEPHPLEPALRTLATTLLAYPHSFLRAARIENIALCRKLLGEGAAETPQHIGGLADSTARRLMVNLEHHQVARPDATLHHEIFHLFDEATAPSGDYRRDPEWEALNPRAFRYGDPASDSIATGFVNDYARTAPVEDKASVFEYLMARPDELCARGADDPILLAKAQLLLSRIEATVPPGFQDFARRKVPCLARR